MIQPSWLSPANSFAGEKSRVDQPEDENGEVRRRSLPAWRGAAVAGLSKTSGYFARNCSRSGFGNWRHARASLPNRRPRSQPVPISMMKTVMMIVIRMALTSE